MFGEYRVQDFGSFLARGIERLDVEGDAFVAVELGAAVILAGAKNNAEKMRICDLATLELKTDAVALVDHDQRNPFQVAAAADKAVQQFRLAGHPIGLPPGLIGGLSSLRR